MRSLHQFDTLVYRRPSGCDPGTSIDMRPDAVRSELRDRVYPLPIGEARLPRRDGTSSEALPSLIPLPGRDRRAKTSHIGRSAEARMRKRLAVQREAECRSCYPGRRYGHGFPETRTLVIRFEAVASLRPSPSFSPAAGGSHGRNRMPACASCLRFATRISSSEVPVAASDQTVAFDREFGFAKPTAAMRNPDMQIFAAKAGERARPWLEAPQAIQISARRDGNRFGHLLYSGWEPAWPGHCPVAGDESCRPSIRAEI